MGVIILATSKEKSTATVTVRPNCLKNCPGMPPMEATGTKTTTMVRVVAITARPISSSASMAARKGGLPMRKCLTMFSISTMASSTRMPITRARPNSDILLSVKPAHCMTAKEGITERGMAIAVKVVARKSLRKTKTTNTASSAPRIKDSREAS